jgi:hypothetical protein
MMIKALQAFSDFICTSHKAAGRRSRDCAGTAGALTGEALLHRVRPACWRVLPSAARGQPIAATRGSLQRHASVANSHATMFECLQLHGGLFPSTLAPQPELCGVHEWVHTNRDVLVGNVDLER